MLKIGNLTLKNDIVLAPVAGYTDAGFRKLAEDFGVGLTYTEMVSAKGMIYNGESVKELLYFVDNKKPKAVQIFGSEPEFVYKAVSSELLGKFDLIDINMGCPVPKIVKNGEGSALMKDPALAAEVVAAAVSAAKGRPVTVKTRLGFEKGNFVADEFANRMEKAGAAAVAVHGRFREQFYEGECDFELLGKVRDSIKIPFLANGDIGTKESLKKAREMTKADGFMIARGALGRPWIFAELQDEEVKIDVKALILEHIAVLRNILPEHIIANNMKKQLCFYAKNVSQAKAVRMEMSGVISLEKLLLVVDKYF